jgi:hypothetical protein
MTPARSSRQRLPGSASPVFPGIILLIVGFVAMFAIIWTIGITIVMANSILALHGSADHAAGLFPVLAA